MPFKNLQFIEKGISAIFLSKLTYIPPEITQKTTGFLMISGEIKVN